MGVVAVMASSCTTIPPRLRALDENVGQAVTVSSSGPAVFQAKVSAWEREGLEAAAKAVAEARGLGLGKVAGPLRAALTGQANAPSVFAVMAALGRDESLGRIDDALGHGTGAGSAG